MAINFPSNPNVNDTHTVGSTVWTWNGTSWTGQSHDPIEIATLTYPSVDGTNGQVLTTDGAGNLSFTNVSADLVSDTTPQLGGDLDLNLKSFSGAASFKSGSDELLKIYDGAGITSIESPTYQMSVQTATTDIYINAGHTTAGNMRLATDSADRIAISSTGTITFNSAYAFPTADGTSGQVLQTDGSGNLTFATVSSGGSSAFSTTYDQVQIETTTPNTDSLNELWFNPDTATWSKSIQNPVTGSVLDTQVASIGSGGPSIVFPSTTTGTIFFGYGLYSSSGVEVIFTTPLWLVSWSHPSFDYVGIHSYILEDDTEVVLYPNEPYSYSNSGTPWATQRVKSLKFASGYRANNTTGTLTAAGAPIWDELEQTFDKPIVIDGVIETSTALTGATGTVVHDTSSSHIFTHSSIAADFTANFTNLSLVANQTTALTLVLTQGATAYIPTAVEIGGAAQTILWHSGSQPTGTASGTDVVTFSIIYNGSSYTVLGNLSSYS